MQLTTGYKRAAHIRLPGWGVLAHNVRKDGRRANLTLDGLILEVGTPGRIRQRYKTLAAAGGVNRAARPS